MQLIEPPFAQVAQLRSPPHSIEAESGVLSGLLLDAAAWDRVGDLVTESDFFRYEHRLIFGAVGALANACKPVDAITVFEHLKAAGKDQEAGGLSYIDSLASFSPSAANIRRYAEIMREQAVLRRLIAACDETATSAFNTQGRAVSELLDSAQQRLQEIHVGTGRVMPTDIGASVVRLLDRIQAAADGTEPRGIPSGIPAFDRMTGGGFKGGKQIILAARPSVGKSSLAEQFCIHVALHEGLSTAFLSQEMSKDELTDRAIANIARVPLDRIISGNLEDDDWSRLTEAVEKLRNVQLFLDEQPALTLADIAAKARMLKRQHDVKLIVIDYLQLCAGGKDKDTRHHQIEHLSRGIKTLAKQLDVCFITLSQLNREVEKRANGRPVLSDLKESGAIEEDADIVMLLSRGQANPNGLQVVNCDVPKNRQGRTGSFALAFDGAYQQWTETIVAPEFKAPPRKHYTEDV
jgi:replicative DNA helicase